MQIVIVIEICNTNLCCPSEAPPSNLSIPEISGTFDTGQILTVSNGTWAGDTPMAFIYQWKRDGSNIDDATNNTYTLVTADRNHEITCTITATNDFGNAIASAVGDIVFSSIVSILASDPIVVLYNTDFDAIDLDTTVDVTLSDLSVVVLNVTWIEGVYDQDAAGIYEIYGDVTLPTGITNPFLVQGNVQITVQEQIFTVTWTAPTGFNTWTVPAGVSEVIAARMIGGGGSGGSMGQIGSSSGAGGAAFAESNNFAVTEGDVLVLYIAPLNISPLPSGSNLDGFEGHPSQLGPAAPPGSTILSGAGAPGGGTGSDGDYYFNTTSFLFYGPKASGSWPAASGTPYVKAAGGKPGIPGGVGALGGATADSIGDTKYAGGNGISPPVNRSGSGGGGAGLTGPGGNGTSTGPSVSTGGIGNSPGGNGGNGSSGSPPAGSNYGGGGPGARNTAIQNTRGGAGAQGWGQVVYSGASVPPIDLGNSYAIAGFGQSNWGANAGTPSATYLGVLNGNIFINTGVGYQPLEYGVNNNPGGDTTGHGPELSWIKQLDNPEVDLYKRFQSGTSMYNHWNINVNAIGLFSVSGWITALSYRAAQGKTVIPLAIGWRQGEADLGVTNPMHIGTYLYGTGVPSSGLGSTGNIYVDKTNNLIYGPKSQYGNTNWGNGFTLFDLSGPGAPSGGTGDIGDTYYDTTGDVYYLKSLSGSGWASATEKAVAVKAAYKNNFTAWYKHCINQVTAAGFDTSLLRLLVSLIDNPMTTDHTYQYEISSALRDVALNFRADNPSYSSLCTDGATISSASYSTFDGVHLTSANGLIPLGLSFAAETVIP